MTEEEIKEKNKIFAMLCSGEREMMILGCKLCFNKGEDWCRENIPYFGPGVVNQDTPRKLEKIMLKVPNYSGSTIRVTDGKLAALISDRIDIRTLNQFGPENIKSYLII